MTTEKDEKVGVDDDSALQTPIEIAAWVRFAAAALTSLPPKMYRGEHAAKVASDAANAADALVVELRKRNRSYDGKL